MISAPRILKRTRAPRQIVILGNPRTGKTQWLHSASTDAPTTSQLVRPGQPTQGIQYALLEAKTAYPLQIRVSDTSGSRSTLDFGSRCKHAVDAVGIWFSATDPQSLPSALDVWAPRFETLTQSARHTPFIFFVETHCDALKASQRKAHRRIIEIALWRLCGRHYMFFQIDARSPSESQTVLHQISQQMYRQSATAAKPRVQIEDVSKNWSTWLERLRERLTEWWQYWRQEEDFGQSHYQGV